MKKLCLIILPIIVVLFAGICGLIVEARSKSAKIEFEGVGFAPTTASDYTQQARLATGIVSDRFANGHIAVSGNTAVVCSGTGCYVYVRSGVVWSQQAVLVPSDGSAVMSFPGGVGLDGDTIVIGGPRATVNSNTNQGAAYVFVRNGTTWSEQQRLTASDGAAGNEFGRSVAISGETIIVGARRAAIGGAANQGAAYTYVRSGASWTEQAKLVANDGGANNFFGQLVAISGDSVVVTRAMQSSGTNPDPAAYVFVRSGSTWSQQQRLSVCEPSGNGGIQCSFGQSISIDGDTLAVGNHFLNVGNNRAQGGVYVYVRSGTSWSQEQRLTASDGQADSLFGSSVSISDNKLLVGAHADIGVPGSAYIFAQTGSSWAQQQRLEVSATRNAFGQFVSMSGSTLLISSPLDIDTPGNTIGAAYVFTSSSVTPTPTPGTLQFSATTYGGNENAGTAIVTVTRAGGSSGAASVQFATAAGGTATGGASCSAGVDYVNRSDTLNWADGDSSSKTFSVTLCNDNIFEGNETVNLALSNATGATLGSQTTATLTINDGTTVVLTTDQVTLKSWTYQGRTYAYVKLSFPDAGYFVADWGLPTRSGNDFTADALVERFSGASVQAVTTTAQIYDLGPLADGNYTFTFKNSGTVVKTQPFTVAAPPFPANPIDNAREFVKQQYRDFLNREADQAGEDFWTDNITKCSDPARRPAGQTEAQCTLRQRETTSGAFFLSPEFQYTGYYVLRMYKGALGRQPKLSEFIPDAQFVGAGILVNSQLSAAKINQNKADFAQQFVNCTDGAKSRCAEFKTIYDGLNNQQYVDKLFQTTGINASAADRAALVNGLNAIPATETRASVLQKVVDGIVVISEGSQTFTTTYGQAFYTAESNRAFVQLEYFGYMKRDPDDAGYAFWLGKLNQFSGNFVNAEMVLAFISSPEYRARFGQP